MSYDAQKLILRELTIQYGTFQDIDLLSPADDPEDPTYWTLGGNFGYLRMGTVTYGIADQFVEYLSKTPHQIVRKDLLQRNITVEFTANQFDSTNFQYLYNALVELGAFNQYWLGSDTPTRPRFGLLGSGTKVDGTVVKFTVWSGSVVTEDLSLKFTGNDYVDTSVMIQAFVAPEFATDPTDYSDDQKCYGMIFEPGSSS
jgi:hypothetical protein